MDKQVSDDETDHYEKTSDNNPTNLNPGAGGFYESADHAINESFQFRLAATLPKSGKYVDYDEYKLIFHDTMSEGVTFENIESVKMGDRELGDYTVEGVKSGDAGKEWTLTVVLPKGQDESYSNLVDGAVVEVIYNAHLNENALVHNESETGIETNHNSVYLEYSNNPNVDIHPEKDYKDNTGQTEPDSVWVFTYEINSIKKADSEDGSPLEGAGFTLYSGETAIKLIKKAGEDGSYIVADQEATQGVITEMVTGADGVFRVIGLDTGNYTLKETTTPPGYTGCSDQDVAIMASHAENDRSDSADLNLDNTRLEYIFVNTSGTALPSTGGMGTKLFRLLGIILILGASIMLVTRRRTAAARHHEQS